MSRRAIYCSEYKKYSYKRVTLYVVAQLVTVPRRRIFHQLRMGATQIETAS